MTHPEPLDLAGIVVEHMVGLHTGLPLVKLTVLATDGTVLQGQMPPDEAAQIAKDIATCRARAEYEVDAIMGLRAAGLDDTTIGGIMRAVRAGEEVRELTADRLPGPVTEREPTPAEAASMTNPVPSDGLCAGCCGKPAVTTYGTCGDDDCEPF
jgi:hypothetical protein